MRKLAGFSMTEMAIVVLIIGLLVGGVTVGIGLFRQAELRAVAAEVENYKVSIEHFTQLYGALPGDITNADGSNNFFDGQTTNGDGNGQIDRLTPSGTEETFAAWDQLSLARYITGSFTGSADSSSATIGVNVPASAHIAGVGYSLAWVAQPASAQDALGRYYSGNYLILASDDNTGTVITGAAIKPDDAFYIDSKSDNGFANSGKILGGGGSCFSGANYTLATTTNVCHLYFSIEQ